MNGFLPINKEQLNDTPDFILVTGDAYVDHPSFGAAIISRVLFDKGYSVGIIAQPNWNNTKDFEKFGKPKLGFLVTGGNIDSMVSHYTVAKKRRTKDLYSPNGQIGLRPDRATIVYCNKIREVYKDVPIVIGGIEASLRRFAHYDYWDDKIRRSILLDSNADILVYGMGELQIVEIAEALKSGINACDITFIKGTCYKTKSLQEGYDFIHLPDFSKIIASKTQYAKSFMLQHENTDSVSSKPLVEKYGEKYGGIFVVQNAPASPLSNSQLDYVFSLPYMRTYHPIYDKKGGVPAIEEVKFSIINSRGCFGSCNFCALAFHQGRVVCSRSHQSVLTEAQKITYEPDFKGYIHDVGGPTANFTQPSCKKQTNAGCCKNRQCLFPNPCKQLSVDHSDYLALLKKLREIPKVKKVFIRSGIRYDYVMHDKDDKFFKELVKNHISGQLKVAPEHVNEKVLEKMGKPQKQVYNEFVKKYYKLNEQFGLNQFLVPYLMSSHPGSTLKAAIELAEYLRDTEQNPEQVQDFYPTPSTLSTCMYYTELDPRNMEKIYVPKLPHEKAMQRALMQYRLPQNYELVLEALKKEGRLDLIGFGKKCLIRPKQTIKHESHKPKIKAKPTKKKTIRNVHKKKQGKN